MCIRTYVPYNMYMDVHNYWYSFECKLYVHGCTHLNVTCMCTNDCMFTSGASKAAPPPVAVEFHAKKKEEVTIHEYSTIDKSKKSKTLIMLSFYSIAVTFQR